MKAQKPYPGPRLNRIEFSTGAKLRRVDVHHVRDDDPLRKGLHILGPHDTWGVLRGLRVDLGLTGFNVRVMHGVAVNRLGVVVMSQRAVHLVAPGDWLRDRTVEIVLGPYENPIACSKHLAADGCTPELKRRVQGVVRFAPVGDAVRSPEGELLCPRTRDEVPLARFTVSIEGQLFPVPSGGRKAARSLAWAPVGHGVVPLDALDWHPHGSSGGWRAVVDTSAAGFERTPAYIVSLTGAPPGVGGVPFVTVLSLSGIHGFGSPGRNRFHVGLLHGQTPGTPPSPLPELIANTQLIWVGAQPVDGCPAA